MPSLNVKSNTSYAVSIVTNINPKAGFLIAAITESKLIWQTWSSPRLGTISNISRGTISFKYAHAYNHNNDFSFTFDPFVLFSKIDGSYGIAYTLEASGKKLNTYSDVIPYYMVNVVFISNTNEGETTGPAMIYTIQNKSRSVCLDSCQSRYDSQGIDCIILEMDKNRTNSSVVNLKKISLKSTGILTNVVEAKTNDAPSNRIIFYKYFPINYGGCLIVKCYVINETKTNETMTIGITGYISKDDFNNPFKNPQNWSMPNGLTLFNPYRYNRIPVGVFQNGTYWLAAIHSNGSWSIYSAMDSRFKSNKYQNGMIKAISPSINRTISLRFEDNFNITYTNNITRSKGNISIYQYYNNDINQRQLRQTYSSELGCFINTTYRIKNTDNVTMSCHILPSTFNAPNSSYIITLDHGFVKRKDSKEPINGLTWIMTTGSYTQPNEYADHITGTLRLSEDGTKHFNDLSYDKQLLFIERLNKELIQSIPTDPSRLTFSGRFNFDLTTPKHQVLLEMKIIETRNSFQPNAVQIMKDLNTLIKNKYNTMLAILPNAGYIDETFPFEPVLSVWEETKFYLLGFGIALAVSVPLYFLACNNIIFFTTILSLAHFVLNISFIIKNGKDVPFLYIPSAFILSLNIGLDAILAFIIFTNEISNYYFKEWLADNFTYAALFTLLAGADVEILLLLNSHFAGFELFNAPFSQKSRDYIFWGKFATIFIDGIPWLIIQ
ncbi:10973_t:CDS:2, partial [Dentiscutata heterogama]